MTRSRIVQKEVASKSLIVASKSLIVVPAFIVVDLFCGAGGTSMGFDRAKYRGNRIAEVIACINHDALAIRNHSNNFPNCIHFTEDVRHMNLQHLLEVVDKYRALYPNAKLILWASLECTHFSNAKTGSRDADSRTLAYALYDYAEVLNPDFIKIENVREFRSWGPLTGQVARIKNGEQVTVAVKKAGEQYKSGDFCPMYFDKKTEQLSGRMVPVDRLKGVDYMQWRQKMESFGYRYDSRLLNSADYGSHQCRLRYFAVFAKPGLPICFPVQTHDKLGRHGLPKWKAVREVLNLQVVGQSIFGRKKDLSPNTLKRVLAGLCKFVATGHPAYMVRSNGGNPTDRVASLEKPSPTVTTSPNGQLVSPEFICQYNGQPDGSVFSTDGPCRTVCTKDSFGLVQAEWLLKSHSSHNNTQLNAGSSIEKPAPTLTCQRQPQLVTATFIDNANRNGCPTSADGPCTTLVTEPRQNLVTAWMDNWTINGRPSSIEGPAPTLVTCPTQSVVSVFMDNAFGCSGEARGASSLNEPSGALTTVNKKSVVHALFMDNQFGCNGKAQGATSLEQPSGTLTTKEKRSVVSADFLMPTSYGNEPTSLEAPAGVITADRHWPYVVSTEGQPWLLANMHQNAGSSLDQPAPTLLTGTHHYLLNPQYGNKGGSIENPCFTLIAKIDKMPPSLVTIEPEVEGDQPLIAVAPAFFKDETICVETRIRVFMACYGIRDIFMRMLDIPELMKIQGFNIEGEPDYVLTGPKDQQKKFIGNAVVPMVVTAWIQEYHREMVGCNTAPQLRMFA